MTQTSFDSIVPYLAVLIFVAMFGYFLYRIVKHGGFRGAVFGARIKATLGEVKGANVPLMRTLVRVHSLDSDKKERAVGIEFVFKGFGYQMMPISLSKEQARQLSALLLSAAT